jgi:hypothetical protein
MKCLAYGFSTTLALTLMAVGVSQAQSVPRSDRLSPLQRNQISRDLIPSSAQDFFRAGQANFEQEIRLLTRPRSPLNEPLLTVRPGAQPQPETKPERPASSPGKMLKP